MQAIGRQPQQAPEGAPVHYERDRPEQTTLYRLVQQHAATFFAQAENAAGADLPQFVKDEFDAFLKCGILAHGFLRLRCSDCGLDKLVAFSGKRRGFCPSCGARRMVQAAAHLVDHVIPHVPVRQWVLVTAHPPALAACRTAQAGDARAAGGVREVFRAVPRMRDEGISVLLVKQNARMSLSIADDVYVLDDGAIVYSGNAAELAADERRVRALTGASADEWKPP